MSPRPELVVVAAELAAHLDRVRKEAESISSLESPAPNPTELWALAAHLQSFCTGCEAIFTRAVARFEGPPEHGPETHLRLLRTAALDLPGVRPRVINATTLAALEPYRAFRHFIRHAYGVDLDWARMRLLVDEIHPTWTLVAEDVQAFREFVLTAAKQ